MKMFVMIPEIVVWQWPVLSLITVPGTETSIMGNIQGLLCNPGKCHCIDVGNTVVILKPLWKKYVLQQNLQRNCSLLFFAELLWVRYRFFFAGTFFFFSGLEDTRNCYTDVLPDIMAQKPHQTRVRVMWEDVMVQFAPSLKGGNNIS